MVPTGRSITGLRISPCSSQHRSHPYESHIKYWGFQGSSVQTCWVKTAREKKPRNLCLYLYIFDSGFHYVAQASLELVIFLPKCRNRGVRHNTSSEQNFRIFITGLDYHLGVGKTKRSCQIIQPGFVSAHHRKRKQRSTGCRNTALTTLLPSEGCKLAKPTA